ncbi:menaquinone-dependent protoporphyrinogen IX dehydrogenase [uncultured Cohaesibacter sp.]|uniref:menaquinone-dependent protoporphyrinogen IX dehydrogenase n=1 Tax=uncultured Cohaesibacter sp. TaxID=1002546 RepID=UPI0029C9633A|nr:menaquinone-dependent protoporphyrinogen IX dehydrogenase [uncultured Cohaesibacter sp.]
MSTIAIYYASQDGQARKISSFLAGQISKSDQQQITVSLNDLASGRPSEGDIGDIDIIVVVAAIRYGRHLKPADQFLQRHVDHLSGKRLVLLSVNLTARKPHKRSVENSVYLKKWLERHPRLSPVLVRAIAGRLDYPRYSFFDRLMIRLIMSITKGPTDPSATIEFTDWEQVRELADEIAAIR